jgi:hypothetical protein
MPAPGHRRVALAASLALALVAPARARGDDVRVPLAMQADLLFMIAAHDRNLPSRAAGEVRTLILTKASDDSQSGAAQFRTAARARASIGGLPHAVEVVPFTTADALAELCRARRLAIVFLAPGFSGAEARAIGQALDGASVLTAAAAPSVARRGVVLGFDLVSGRVKLLLDRAQAAKQRVAFSADVLGLMAESS